MLKPSLSLPFFDLRFYISNVAHGDLSEESFEPVLIYMAPHRHDSSIVAKALPLLTTVAQGERDYQLTMAHSAA